MATDVHRPVVELIALLASAGGLDALSTVLRDLPADFPAAVVVQQHLGDNDSILPSILRRQTARQISWAEGGQALAPGQVVVCPPGMHLELTSDHRCRLRKVDGPAEKRFDALLTSLAGSYGARSVGVVLSGSGRDGADGTAAMKRAGAIVIAESPETALYGSMPVAAARAGADLVLPIHEIGAALAGIVDGAPLNALRRPPAAALADDAGGATTVLATEHEAVSRLAPPDRATDWATNRATSNAATRAEIARVRAAELRQRRLDLSAGSGATSNTVATARRRAEESRRRAQLAHQSAEEAAARWGTDRMNPPRFGRD